MDDLAPTINERVEYDWRTWSKLANYFVICGREKLSNLVPVVNEYVVGHRRTRSIVAIYFAIWIASFYAVLRFSLGPLYQSHRVVAIIYTLALFLSVKVVCALMTASFRELWYHASRQELAVLFCNIALTGGSLFLILLCWPGLGIPPWVAVFDSGLSLLALSSVRVLWHIAQDGLLISQPSRAVILAGRRAFVELELHRLHVRPTGDKVVALLLEDKHTEGALLRRIPVLERQALEPLLRQGIVVTVVLLTPVSPSFRADLEAVCQAHNLCLRLITSSHLSSEMVESAGAELLGRQLRHVDARAMKTAIQGKRVMVTGGGGSIGSELARQLASLDPAELVVVDRAENALFNIEHDLALHPRAFPIRTVILDIQDAAAVKRQFLIHRPQIVFHAAAYKHVPMMERHPSEAYLNNVGGTRILVDAADEYGVETFVFISTDKAVNPSGVMGTTKWLGEMYIKSKADKSRTRFAAVRFGNVLGSSGSVLPIFIEQIRRGRPITITHPEMTRYFMSIPEACNLVLQAAELAERGEIFVLDMGQPVKIVDLAHRLIKHAGLRSGDDVPIVYTGIRPGERLSEQLYHKEEQAIRTAVPGVWLLSSSSRPRATLLLMLEQIEQLARAGNDDQVVRLMAELVQDYHSRRLRLSGNRISKNMPAAQDCLAN
jgi:FlaA1/EpsC-like NDP-sugar epimerase